MSLATICTAPAQAAPGPVIVWDEYPNLAIRKVDTERWTGTYIVNSTGRRQTVRLAVRPGRRGIFELLLMADGTADTCFGFNVAGAEGDRHFSPRYRDEVGVDVTETTVAGTQATPCLDVNGVSITYTLGVHVAKNTRPGGAITLRVNGIGLDGTDTVRARVVVV